jgi:hypothetical protein
LAELSGTQLLGEANLGVFWLFFIVEDLQQGFGLIILGEVENLQFVYVKCLW